MDNPKVVEISALNNISSRVRLRSQAHVVLLFLFLICAAFTFSFTALSVSASVPPAASESAGPSINFEYLWYEAENMAGFSTNERYEPILNSSWVNPPKAKAPGWGINGPGVSAEWTQGGESEWNSAAASADESRGTIYQDIKVPRAGEYKFWVRYADWAKRTENFTVRITQNDREVFRHEFGAKDLVDPHDEISMYWQWAFTWDGASCRLSKGPARVSIEIEKPAEARRHVDCFLLTSNLDFRPSGRTKPDFAAMRYLRAWSTNRPTSSSLLQSGGRVEVPTAWLPRKIAGRDFLMPWNISKEFWKLYGSAPPEERPLYPFNAEPIEEFIKKYKGAADVPLFSSKLVVPVIYINDLPEYFKEGSPFLAYLRQTKVPFAILINYGAARWTEGESQAQAAWKLLNGEFREQFLGWISGESVGYVWDEAPTDLKLSPQMSRRELLQAHREFYTRALERKWRGMFHTNGIGPMWDKLIPAQSTSSTSFSHALSSWGTKLLGIETAAVQPITAMRIAFTRGAARQFNGQFLYYHAPNFGDTATSFTRAQNFAGPDNFFHTRYGATMGPSLAWYRKSYFLYYMAGASAIYLEQGGDQFFKPGPGEHPFQLNPLGRITNEFMRFAERHPDRGVPYTPIAFLLDPAHGWDMTDYPQWPFGVSQINRSDRALRELIGAAYYPAPVTEGEPATADRQAHVSSVFGDIFDVIVASDTGSEAVDNYRAVVVGGRVEWSPSWVTKLESYVKSGGVLVINAAQTKGMPPALLGVNQTAQMLEADEAHCLAPGDANLDLRGQVFEYQRVETKPGTEVLVRTASGDPLVTVNKVGKGKVVFVALPDLLGEDERLTPFVAHVLTHLCAEATPVKVLGEIEYLVNRKSGGWVITLINNKGVLKPQQGMAEVDRTAYADVTLSLKGAGIDHALEWIDEKKIDVSLDKSQSFVKVRIAPGSVAVVELVEKRF